MPERRPHTAAAPPGRLPSLPLSLAAGALRSPFTRRPAPEVGAPPGGWLVVPGVRIDPARLAAYARVCGFPAEGPVPLPYPHVLAFPLALRLMAARDFPLPLLGLVHTRIEVAGHRHLRPAEPLELAVRAEGFAPHRRGTEATVVTEARVGGEPVWESRSGYLARHGRPTGAGRDTPEPPAGAPTTGPGCEDPAPATGPLPARAVWRLGPGLGRRYGRVSGDLNPIHLHPLTARPFGFRRPIAHGMWTFARCLAESLPPYASGAVQAEAEFKTPVPLPSTVTHVAGAGSFALLDEKNRPHCHGSFQPMDPLS
ncbi:MaoC/PaaZ C-terminal domain-containing protein [Streptomyces sp. NPDC015131]|uniref:MaoC/PaaZ C-terminal domain-containing protein n=1 Tax=Streptomyces sp. NPDC015131 TaxID=3364941 RepID=UPI0036F93411